MDCKHCGSSLVDWEFRDAIGCIVFIECYNCRETGPCSEKYGAEDKQLAINEAIERWNNDR